MKRIYYLWYVIWLLPAALAGLGIQQALVYYGIQNTQQNGQEYHAEVIEFQMKHMAAQSNGLIVLQFTPERGDPVVKKLSLPIQNAGMLMESETVDIKYLESSYQPVIILPTLWFHTKMVQINIGVLLLSLIVTVLVSVYTHRYANKLRSKSIEVQPSFEFPDS